MQALETGIAIALSGSPQIALTINQKRLDSIKNHATQDPANAENPSVDGRIDC
jgi:hypothetical protein